MVYSKGCKPLNLQLYNIGVPILQNPSSESQKKGRKQKKPNRISSFLNKKFIFFYGQKSWDFDGYLGFGQWVWWRIGP